MTNYETVDTVHNAANASLTSAKPTARFDLMQGQLHGKAEDKTGQGGLHKIFNGRCPLNGIELDGIGKEYGVSVAVHSNTNDGFSLHVNDSKVAADELTQYQIMKGGYDGRKKVLTQIARAHIVQLDNPYVTFDFYLRDQSLENLLGPLPDNLREGTLDKWREDGWRNEAKRIIKDINAYNPVHHELCRLTRSWVAREVTPEEAQWEAKDPDQHLFREDESITVHAIKIQTLAKNRYLNNTLTLLGQVRQALEIKG